MFSYFIETYSTTLQFDDDKSTTTSTTTSCRQTPFDDAQSTINRVSKTAVWRWLTITTIDMLLNTPEHILRLITIVHSSTFTITPSMRNVYHRIATIARLLYFAQYCFNAAYLFAIVYRPADTRHSTPINGVSRRRQRAYYRSSSAPHLFVDV